MWIGALIAVIAVAGAPAFADSPTHTAAKFVSGCGNIIYLAAGVGLPLLTDGKYGTDHSLRTVDSLAVTMGLTEGLKATTREKRPDSDEHDSFPSGHAAAAFSVAAMESSFHPHEAVEWYAGAALISLSRIRLNRHYPHDVLAGALIGYGSSRWEASQPHGLILSPWIRSDRPGVLIETSF